MAIEWQPDPDDPDGNGKCATLGHLTLSAWPMSDGDWNWSIEAVDKYSDHVRAVLADGSDGDPRDEAEAVAQCEAAATALGWAIVMPGTVKS